MAIHRRHPRFCRPLHRTSLVESSAICAAGSAGAARAGASRRGCTCRACCTWPRTARNRGDAASHRDGPMARPTCRAGRRLTHRKEHSALHRSEPRCRLSQDDIDSISRLLAALTNALAPLESLMRGKHDFATLAQFHRETLVRLSTTDDGRISAFDGHDGQQLAQAFDELPAATPTHITLEIADYPDLFSTAFAGSVVRRPQNTDASLRIYGLLEARLTQCDRVILGGLVEGVWPPAPRIDPWLSRPMRHDLGLDLPERRIGLTAHDFAQLLGADDVILTHATKVGGAPSVASRVLHRMKAIVKPATWDAALARGAYYVRCAAALDHPERVEPVAQPAPKPPVALRPLQMSVTEIEDWLRDPYTIFAKRIL